ncbi:MAG: hypothetical protein ACREQ9_14085 [Candidatus Binatia bacterium]
MDFAFFVPGESAVRSILARALRDCGLDGEGKSRAAWRRMAAFATQWADPSSVLGSTVREIWCEVDLPHGTGEEPAPFLILNIDPAAGNDRPVFDRERMIALLRAALAALLEEPLSEAAAERLRSSVRALASTARPMHVAAMPGRGVGPVRLILRMPRREVVPYLRRGSVLIAMSQRSSRS